MTRIQDLLFTSAFERAVLRWYYRVFSIAEIEQSRTLKFAFGALLFAHYIAFSSWLQEPSTTVDAAVQGTHRCWPYFQSCGEWLFLQALPIGYSQSVLYMLLFGSFVLCGYLMYRNEWLLAHIVLVPAFVWHFLVTFVFTMALAGNYEYYLFILTLILLFLPHKLFFLQLSLVFFYVLSTVAKNHEAWILGTYFSALKEGLPLFPKWSIPIWTNLVIFMEMVGAWFLMSRPGIMQRSVLAFFVLFHLYSGILVGYRYPATVLPVLFIVFGPLYQKLRVPFDRRSIIGWSLIALMLCLQFVPRVIPGDEKLTLEGNYYGLYMFESNHQCRWVARIHTEDGVAEEVVRESVNARYRCDPYAVFFSLKSICQRHEGEVTRIEWTFDHSINGNPFLRIVDVQDACALSYRPFAHNAWIKTENDEPAVVGYPVENHYR